MKADLGNTDKLTNCNKIMTLDALQDGQLKPEIFQREIFFMSVAVLLNMLHQSRISGNNIEKGNQSKISGNNMETGVKSLEITRKPE